MINVLVPTDFSKPSFNALNYAHMLFQDQAATFTLLHCYSPSALQLIGNKSPMRLGGIYKSLKEESNKKLTRLRDQILSKNEIEAHMYRTAAQEGSVRDVIASTTPGTYDFLVMGSKGASGLKEIFIGSTTYSIVSLQQSIPVLVIPVDAHFKIPDTIGFATDFKRDYSIEELTPLLSIIKMWQAKLHMIEVYTVSDLNAKQKAHLLHLETLLATIDYKFHVIPKFSSLENCVNVFDNELEIDLLTMIDYPKTFFERLMREPIVKKMSFHTTLPFLILPGHH